MSEIHEQIYSSPIIDAAIKWLRNRNIYDTIRRLKYESLIAEAETLCQKYFERDVCAGVVDYI
jgi:hypothetical protein